MQLRASLMRIQTLGTLTSIVSHRLPAIGIIEQLRGDGHKRPNIPRWNEDPCNAVCDGLAHGAYICRHNRYFKRHRLADHRGETLRARFRGEPKDVQRGGQLVDASARVVHNQVVAN